MKLAPWIALLLALFTVPALAQRQGDWVLARFQGGPYWFPGVIQNLGGGSITVRYDDGMVERLPANQVRPYDWRVGSRVECNWKNGGTWYGGRITALNNARLSVRYDDGDFENTTTGLCRSQ